MTLINLVLKSITHPFFLNPAFVENNKWITNADCQLYNQDNPGWY